MIRPTLVDLNPIELNHYSFMTSLDKPNGSCVLNKTKDINIKVFNMITRINQVKTLVKHISFDFDHTVCNLNQKWSNGKCHCACKKYHSSKKYFRWKPSTCVCDIVSIFVFFFYNINFTRYKSRVKKLK